MNAVESYQTLYHQLAEQLPGHNVAWVRAMREASLLRLKELGFPNHKQEAWKYTQLQALEKELYQPIPVQRTNISDEEWQQLPLASLDASRLVFVDGHFSRAMSDMDALPPGVLISELSSLLNSKTNQPLAMFQNSRLAEDAIHALNDAFITDGAAINILADVQVVKPIHLQYISTAQDKVASYSRNIFIMEPNSRAQVIESHVALGEGKYVNNVQTDIHLAAGAQLEHYKLQLEGRAGLHFSATQVEQAQASHYQNHLFAFGSQLMRNELKLKLNGEQATCLLNGLFLAQGSQHLDMQTQIDHRSPACTSRETYRGIADEHGHGVFDGKVKVHPGAQLSDARVTSNNLLLSQGGEIDTKPQLEIFANDVKCSHGATIGQLDEDVLFYLCSRGIDKATARNLMLFAFASHNIELCPLEDIKGAARELLLKHLHNGDQLQESLR